MEIFLRIVVILVSVLLGLAILVQVSGSNANPLDGSQGGFRARRGFELTIFRTTIVLGVIFVVSSILMVAFG